MDESVVEGAGEVGIYWIQAAPFIAALLLLIFGLFSQGPLAERTANEIRTKLKLSKNNLAHNELDDYVGDGLDRSQSISAILATAPALVFGVAIGNVWLLAWTAASIVAIILLILFPVRSVRIRNVASLRTLARIRSSGFGRWIPRPSGLSRLRVTWHWVATMAFSLVAVILALFFPAVQS